MNKKGIFFLLDIVIGLFILVIGLLIVLNIYLEVPISDQLSYYSTDATYLVSTFRSDEFYNPATFELFKTGDILEDEFLSESIARFCSTKNETNFQHVMSGVFDTVIPPQFSIKSRVLYLNETPCLSYDKGDMSNFNYSSIISSSRILIFTKNKNYDSIGPYILEVKSW